MPGSKLEQQPEELVRVLDNHGHRDARAEVLASTWAGGVDALKSWGVPQLHRGKRERERWSARTHVAMRVHPQASLLCCTPSVTRGVCVCENTHTHTLYT